MAKMTGAQVLADPFKCLFRGLSVFELRSHLTSGELEHERPPAKSVC